MLLSMLYTCKASMQRKHRGGRGLAKSLAVFLYYLHPPRNFFCTNVPRMGSVVRMVTIGCMPSSLTLPYPHAPHTTRPRVCSLKEECLAFMWLPSRRCTQQERLFFQRLIYSIPCMNDNFFA